MVDAIRDLPLSSALDGASSFTGTEYNNPTMTVEVLEVAGRGRSCTEEVVVVVVEGSVG